MQISGLWRIRHLYHYCRNFKVLKIGKRFLKYFLNRSNEWLASHKRVTEGVNIIGYAKGDFGLAEHARLVTHAMNSTTVPFCVNDTVDPGGHTQTNEGIRQFIQKKNPYKINLFCYNASEIVAYMHAPKGGIAQRKHYNIGYGYWELSEFPTEWTKQNNYLKELWAPSTFIKEVLEKSTALPVHYMPIAVDFESPVGYSRQGFNLPENKFLFLFTFDLSSYIARKNPQAVIDAFTQAFPTAKNEEVCLVIKINSLKSKPEHFHKQQALLDKIKVDPRIILIDEIVDRNTILGLINVCDAYVSLHRSEGFGLGMAEAMKMGKVVIATHYSGNKDFMNEHNSCPVKYKLVRVAEEEYCFVERDAVWAEPDIEHAVYYMKKVFTEREFAANIGRVARDYIKEHHSFNAIGLNYKHRVAEILKG